MHNKLMILVIIISLATQFVRAANQYQAADDFLKSNNFKMAAKEYNDLIEAQGGLKKSQDIRAMTGSFIAYHMLKEYKKSFELCKRALKIQAYNSTAIFFAGQNLEALGNDELALNLYKYYAMLQESDPYLPFIKACYEKVKRKLFDQTIKKAIQQEGRVSSQNIPDNNIVILYFVNKGDNDNWDSFGKGYSGLLSHDLDFIDKVNIVDRQELQILLDKLQFSQKALNDENLIPRLGRLLNARIVISGSYKVINNFDIQINLGILNLSQPDLIEQTEYSGSVNDIFDIEKQIIQKIISEFKIPVSAQERRNFMAFSTQKFDAFIDYCEGLNYYDKVNIEEAKKNLSQAIRKDNYFQLAKSLLDNIDALEMIKQGNLAELHFQISGKSYQAPTGEIAFDGRRARLQNISINLNLGYLPGIDSRNGSGSLDLSNFTRKLLPEPTPPPSN